MKVWAEVHQNGIFTLGHQDYVGHTLGCGGVRTFVEYIRVSDPHA